MIPPSCDECRGRYAVDIEARCIGSSFDSCILLDTLRVRIFAYLLPPVLNITVVFFFPLFHRTVDGGRLSELEKSQQ